MPDYDLSRLSTRSFEHLVQALAVKVIGPDVTVFGDGPDGGREATFDGKRPYPFADDGWDGYGVIQAKFLQRPKNPKDDGQWAIDQLRSELQKYVQPESTLRKPEYFIFATNVVLTPVKDHGSKDRVKSILNEYKERLSLTDYEIWDYDQIRAFLDDNSEIRQTYAAWITTGDVLAEIVKWLQPQASDFEDTIANFLQKELLSDEYVNLEQAGHDASERIPLARVFVDLHTRDAAGGVQDIDDDVRFPYRSDSSEETGKGFIKEILEVSSERLNGQSQSIHTIQQPPEPGDRHHSPGRFVLIGGPGQGKTTVGQFICQIFRASIISRKSPSSLSPETANTLSMIEDHCRDEGIDRFPVPRFPFRIVLNEFASALSDSSLPEISSVFSYLASSVRKRTDREISADDLRKWVGKYPSVIIFDGLDEVPSSSNREQVLTAIKDFWVDASNSDADVLAIATSRPQGYNEDFSRTYYDHRWLVPLSRELGQHFAKRLADVRYGTDSDRREKVLSRLERSFDNESTSRLMRTPLQITIMTALVDRMGLPPRARWNLFEAYYHVIYQREVEREIPASDLLRHYEPDINAIHSRVGLLLQIDSERSGATHSRFSADRFKAVVEERLIKEGHEGEDLNDLVGRIFEAALERLVFLVGLESGQVGFEIRSLQEFMAAECLMAGDDEAIKSRLRGIAPIPNWRNVFLFASGKCFADRQHLREAIVQICMELNEPSQDAIAGTYLVGSGLAIDLIEDGLARHQPNFAQSLARIAIRALDVPNPDYHSKLSSVYEPQFEHIYSEELMRRLNDSREYMRRSAWRCLVSLVDSHVVWARDLAEGGWPSEIEDQLKLWGRGDALDRSWWVTSKFLEVMPQIPVQRLPELLSVHPIGTQGLSPRQASRAKILQVTRSGHGGQISFLQSRLDLPMLQESDKQSSLLREMGNLEDFDPSWTVYKVAAEFSLEPSKQRLSSALMAIAPLLDDGINVLDYPRRTTIPWPILACMDMCTDASQMVELSSKALRGQLGDASDWVAAENRWIERGITLEDIRSMTNDRVPFDNKISTLGFPATLKAWPMEIPGDIPTLLAQLSSIHSQLPKSAARSFVARVFELCLFHASFFAPADDELIPDSFNVQTLLSIYEDLGPGRLLPFELIIGRIGGSSHEIASGCSALADCRPRLFPYIGRGPINPDQIGRICQSFQEVTNNAVMLPVIGWLAEQGYLADHHLDVPDPRELELVEHKVGALLTALAMESWEADHTERFLGLIQEIGPLSKEGHERVLNTVQENRQDGAFLDEFLVSLEKILPHHKYETRIQYIYMLENRLRKRVSKLSDFNHSP